MIEIEEIHPLYICNRSRACAVSPGCGDGQCEHTTCPVFAQNKEAVEVLNKFREMFHVVVDDNANLIVTERIKRDDSTN